MQFRRRHRDRYWYALMSNCQQNIRERLSTIAKEYHAVIMGCCDAYPSHSTYSGRAARATLRSSKTAKVVIVNTKLYFCCYKMDTHENDTDATFSQDISLPRTPQREGKTWICLCLPFNITDWEKLVFVCRFQSWATYRYRNLENISWFCVAMWLAGGYEFWKR